MRRSLTAGLAVLSLLGAPGAAARAADSGWTDLDDVRLGEQVWGTRISRHDLEGRIVVTYHWCVSCPMSTGAFPYVNSLVAKYAPRGVAFVGLQVRREPEVAENDVVWYLAHLKPDFPVTRLGWVSEWPAQWLPWAVVFDPQGKRIFAGNLPGIEKVLDDALARGPDPVLGGPYAALRPLAERIAADRAHAGRHLAEVRRIAGATDGDPAEQAEAAAMLAAVERYVAAQVAKAEEDMPGPVERAGVHAELAAMLEGDELGTRAAERLGEIRSAPGYAAEAEAWAALQRARAAFRWLPPPGEYIYHPTEMHYRMSDSAPLRERRTRMIAEFRLELERIEREAPGTTAAGEASDLLLVHDVPEMDADEARDRVARAEKLLAKDARPVDLLEGTLLLYEVTEGYLGADDTAAKAERLYAEVTVGRAKDLAAARAARRALEDEVGRIEEEVRVGGSLFPRARADELIRRLDGIAEEAGRSSELARRIGAYARSLEESYAGPSQLGVGFDAGHEGPGVRIGQVFPGTAAEKDGLRPGDVILRFEGKEIASPQDLGAAIQACRPFQAVKVEVRRAGSGETETVEVVLGRRG